MSRNNPGPFDDGRVIQGRQNCFNKSSNGRDGSIPNGEVVMWNCNSGGDSDEINWLPLFHWKGKEMKRSMRKLEY
ncbi:hypothetical protein C5167_008290 [Papaver somniferum]|uniref:Uncharacterized protein n=1 Tax=Papaver somniferum TaxID=3469 RepID=A0A4Y7JXZ2_PAPSO|nr:hypothetical protein C5167_008290 [Papaver somniferum]